MHGGLAGHWLAENLAAGFIQPSPMSRPSMVKSLRHDLHRAFAEFRAHRSTESLVASRLFQRLKHEVDAVLESVVRADLPSAAPPREDSRAIRVTAWNLEWGAKLDGILEVLRSHPVISKSDIFLLTEVDYGMARSGNRLVAEEIARALSLAYVFAPSYLFLGGGGDLPRSSEPPHTRLRQAADTTNLHAICGNAILSRHAIREAQSFPLPSFRDKMASSKQRLGTQRSLTAVIDHPMGPLRVAGVHLNAFSSQEQRRRQMLSLLADLETLSPAYPTLIGGDWNTSTYNSDRALSLAAAFLKRAVIGLGEARKHQCYPDRELERSLFGLLESSGYDYRDLNALGICTAHYDLHYFAGKSRALGWLPARFNRWLERRVSQREGLLDFKLDWFAGRSVRPSGDAGPRVIGDLSDETGALSDHDAIVVDLLLAAGR